MKNYIRTIQLSIPGDLKNVSLVGAAVNKFCKLYPFPESEAFRIELCLSEAINNVIKHSYDCDVEKVVVLDVSMTNEEMEFRVRDRGKANDNFKIPDFDFDPTDIPNLPESGMGLFIINEVMDQVSYEVGSPENVLTMVKRFPVPMTTEARLRPFPA
ncbi:MAG: ATP-binding protein [Calditrichaeota bacterium]|nr:ATP-binding protein [Calditrichota bacterium]HQU72983.1 ATP-binding protein [Calditrichia bacterium]